MGKVVELSDDTYHQLAELAQHQQRTLEVTIHGDKEHYRSFTTAGGVAMPLSAWQCHYE
jgi:hypothetical protein